jgi:hypothetical protein
MKKLLLSASLLSSLLLASACGDEEEVENPDVEGCEHLQEGPAAPVTAGTGAGAPAVDDDHRRYDITLADVAGGKGGDVTFASSEAGDYILFLGAAVPVAVLDAAGATVPFESSSASSDQCTEVKARHQLELGVGTYTLRFGPSALGAVGLVVEPAAHEDPAGRRGGRWGRSAGWGTRKHRRLGPG